MEKMTTLVVYLCNTNSGLEFVAFVVACNSDISINSAHKKLLHINRDISHKTIAHNNIACNY